MSGDRQGNPPTPTPEVMTIDDLAVYLQVLKSSLYKLAQEGRVSGQKVGRHWRFHKGLVDRWLEGESVGSAKNKPLLSGPIVQDGLKNRSYL